MEFYGEQLSMAPFFRFSELRIGLDGEVADITV